MREKLISHQFTLKDEQDGRGILETLFKLAEDNPDFTFTCSLVQNGLRISASHWEDVGGPSPFAQLNEKK